MLRSSLLRKQLHGALESPGLGLLQTFLPKVRVLEVALELTLLHLSLGHRFSQGQFHHKLSTAADSTARAYCPLRLAWKEREQLASRSFCWVSGVSALSLPGASSWTSHSALESVAMHGSSKASVERCP